MKNFLIFIFLSAFFPCVLSAQVAYMEEKAKVNKIKRNSQYLYGEGVAATLEDATSLAEQNLKNAILTEMSGNDKLQGADKILVNSIKKHSEKIQLKRGAMERVFLYVEKKNLFPADRMVALDISASVQPESVVVDEIPEQSGDENPDVIERKSGEVPSGYVDTGADSQKKSVFESLVEPVSSSAPVEVSSSVLQTILTKRTVSELESLMRNLKAEHKLMWGNVRSSVNPQWYVAVFSRNEVKAVLDRETSGKRTDLLTGKQAALDDYASDVKVWFILYE